jgi:tetratricopeptide (TPR) repeat protein
VNPLFLAELGHVYQLKKDWAKSIELYDQAFASTAAYSPENSKLVEKGRFLRGKAYSLVELKQFDDAKAVYRDCLVIDPNDRRAKAELKYIEDLQAKAAAK